MGRAARCVKRHLEHLLGEIGTKRVDEVGALEFRTLEARVRGRGVDPRPHLALLRTMLREVSTPFGN